MTTPYSKRYGPPAPVLDVTLAYPGASLRLGPFSALVDTGGDGTFVPLIHLEKLGAPLDYPAVVRPIFGPARHVYVYTVDFIIASILLPKVGVIGDEDGSEFVLGRNVLNRLILLLDGPKTALEILDNSRLKRSTKS